ncbi:MAG: 3-isopropylmalate dehydratase small subunit [Candidatus Sumerlaeia bacterium]|nr:3-isopropylmalate dehydratase small subunit [Candidatus Sumerlaeia bacterium]
MPLIEGRVWKFGDHVNTDVIFPGKYTYTISEPADMARHAMEDADPEFAQKVRAGDIVVAGENFGCGSSREQAVICLKAAGVAAIVAKSFARIYYRNAINQGLPIVQCPEAVDAIESGDRVAIDLNAGVLEHAGNRYRFAPLPPEVSEILAAGGLVEYVKRKKGG